MTNEEIKRAGEVMIAAAMKKPIQLKAKGDDKWEDGSPGEHLGWNWTSFDYRVKPTKKLRPWKWDEVPLGAQTRVPQFPSERTMIVGVTSTGVMLAQDNASYPFGDIMKFREYSIDGGKTWLRCGVEVEE